MRTSPRGDQVGIAGDQGHPFEPARTHEGQHLAQFYEGWPHGTNGQMATESMVMREMLRERPGGCRDAMATAMTPATIISGLALIRSNHWM